MIEHDFVTELEDERQEMGLTRKEFSAILGIKETTYYNYVSRHSYPRPIMLEHICGMMGWEPTLYKRPERKDAKREVGL